MKRIILFSVLFGLITNTAFASYYKTSTHNCNRAAMLDTLDNATAQHRAVITEVECATPSCSNVLYNNSRRARPAIEAEATSEVFVYQERTEEVRPVQRVQYVMPIYVQYVRKPVVKHVVVRSVSEQETCVSCSQETAPAAPVVVPVKTVEPVVTPVAEPVVEDEDDEIVQCEKYGKCAS